MSVDVRRMLETMGGSLMTGQVLTLEADYQQRTAFMLGTLLLFASQEWDAAAERLSDENRAMREIFADAAPVLAGSALGDKLAAVPPEDTSLRISVLQASNNELRALLIELHAAVEERDTPDAKAIEARIWAELVASTERRILPGAPF